MHCIGTSVSAIFPTTISQYSGANLTWYPFESLNKIDSSYFAKISHTFDHDIFEWQYWSNVHTNNPFGNQQQLFVYILPSNQSWLLNDYLAWWVHKPHRNNYVVRWGFNHRYWFITEITFILELKQLFVYNLQNVNKSAGLSLFPSWNTNRFTFGVIKFCRSLETRYHVNCII